MTSNFIKLLFLNFLLCFFVSIYPSFEVVNNDGGATMRDMADSPRAKQHRWQLVGGKEANVMDFPFQAVLIVNLFPLNNEITCGGTIIAESFLITTANCVCQLYKSNCPVFDASWFTVYVGSTYNLNLRINALDYKVEKIKIHPLFNVMNWRLTRTGMINFNYDLAVVKINGDFVFGQYVQKINLPTLNTNEIKQMEDTGTVCTAYGWSSSVDSGFPMKNISLQLYSTKLKLISFETCSERWYIKGYKVNSDVHICAVGIKQSICMGDNGEGLVCEMGQNKSIMGIAMMTTSCGSEKSPSVFTRIDANLNFINDFINEDDEKSSKSSGNFIYNQLVAQFYSAPVTSVFLSTLILKSGFYERIYY